MQKIQKKFLKIIIIITSIILIIIGVASLFMTAYFNGDAESANEKTLYKLDNIFLNLILILIFLFFIYEVSKIENKIIRNILVILGFVGSFIIQGLWILKIKFIPESDQGYVIYCAKALTDRGMLEFITQPGNYLNLYPFQIGFAKYLQIIMKIVNSDKAIYMQMFNVIYSIINLILMYKITGKLFQDKKIKSISLILILGFSIYFMFFNVHVYGNIIGLMFSLMALYVTLTYLENKKLYKVFLIAIFITVAIILKSNYNIFLCGIIVTMIFEVLKNRKIRDVISILLILALCITGKNIFYKYIEKSIDMKLSEGVPMISYIYMGIAEPTGLSSGWYTEDTLRIYSDCNYDNAQASEKSKELIIERLDFMKKHPYYTIKYFGDKIASTWLNPTFQTVWCSKPGIRLEWYPDYNEYFQQQMIVKSMLGGKLYNLEELYFNTYQIIIFIFAGYGILQINKNNEIKHILLPIIFLGGFVFHILWETKAIYVLQYYFLLIPYSSLGLKEFYIKIKNIKLKFVKNRKY